jgi:hypothetical protein
MIYPHNLNRKQAELALRTADLAQLPAFCSHPSAQVRKRAAFKLARFEEHFQCIQGRTGHISREERESLRRVLELLQPKSIAKAAADLGVTQGRVKAGLFAWSATLRV